MGRAFVKEVFQDKETMEVGDVGIEESDINSRHDGVGGKGNGERPNDLEEMVSVFYVGGDGFDDGLEVGVDVGRDTFSGRGEGNNNGTVRIVRFVDFGKEVKEWGAGFGIEEKR